MRCSKSSKRAMTSSKSSKRERKYSKSSKRAVRYSKSSKRESDEVFKIQQEREEVFKIQQERESAMRYSKSSKRERGQEVMEEHVHDDDDESALEKSEETGLVGAHVNEMDEEDEIRVMSEPLRKQCEESGSYSGLEEGECGGNLTENGFSVEASVSARRTSARRCSVSYTAVDIIVDTAEAEVRAETSAHHVRAHNGHHVSQQHRKFGIMHGEVLMHIVTCLATIGGFLFGYDLGLVSGALEFIEEDMQLNEVQDQVIVMATKLGAFFGTFVGGAAMLAYGRRACISTSAGFFLIGPAMMAAASGPALLTVGRFAIGIGIGMSAVVVPAYLGELSPPDRRGAVVAVYEVAVGFGMFIAPLVDYLLSGLEQEWRYMVAAPAVPSILLLVAVLALPESPRWLVMRGLIDEAMDTLLRLRGGGLQSSGHSGGNASSDSGSGIRVNASATNPDEIAEDELLDIWSTDQKNKAFAAEARAKLRTKVKKKVKSIPENSSNADSWPRTFNAALTDMFLDLIELSQSADRSAFCIAMWLALVNQLCASTAIINYGPKLLDKIAGGDYERGLRYVVTITSFRMHVWRNISVCYRWSLSLSLSLT